MLAVNLERNEENESPVRICGKKMEKYAKIPPYIIKILNLWHVSEIQ